MAQLSFEHYEKMTDSALSLEGKANYLSPIIQRNNLSSPLVVLPLLAGWDLSHRWGGSSSTTAREAVTNASISRPSVRARPSPKGTLRLGFRSDLDAKKRLELGALALYEAGDNDPSTGGPDFVRETSFP
jgi:proteasome beta subunit